MKVDYVIISGQDGVMVSTYRIVTTHHNETVKLNDKNTFNLKAKSHEDSLSGILCEQSSSIFNFLKKKICWTNTHFEITVLDFWRCLGFKDRVGSFICTLTVGYLLYVP